MLLCWLQPAWPAAAGGESGVVETHTSIVYRHISTEIQSRRNKIEYRLFVEFSFTFSQIEKNIKFSPVNVAMTHNDAGI